MTWNTAEKKCYLHATRSTPKYGQQRRRRQRPVGEFGISSEVWPHRHKAVSSRCNVGHTFRLLRPSQSRGVPALEAGIFPPCPRPFRLSFASHILVGEYV